MFKYYNILGKNISLDGKSLTPPSPLPLASLLLLTLLSLNSPGSGGGPGLARTTQWRTVQSDPARASADGHTKHRSSPTQTRSSTNFKKVSRDPQTSDPADFWHRPRSSLAVRGNFVANLMVACSEAWEVLQPTGSDRRALQ